jgi:hypothetical protein
MAAGRRVEQIAMSEMPRPGDISPGFFIQQGRCFRMVYSKQLQSTHCYESTVWRGRFTDAKGMLGRRLSRRCQAQHLVGVRSVGSYHLALAGPSLCEGAGLIEHHGAHLAECLERFPGAHDDSLVCCIPCPSHDGKGGSDAHRARVTHDEYAERGEDCPLDVNTVARGPGTDQPTDECNAPLPS